MAPIDIEKSLFYLEKSAALENAEAANNLGWRYTHGLKRILKKLRICIVKQYYSEAIELQFSRGIIGVLRQNSIVPSADGSFDRDYEGAIEAYKNAITLMGLKVTKNGHHGRTLILASSITFRQTQFSRISNELLNILIMELLTLGRLTLSI